MKSNARFTGFASKFLLMCILLHFSSALPLAKLSAAPPPKDHDAEAKAASSSRSATSKAVSLPLFFEANKGQTDPSVRFLSRSAGYTLFLTPTETVLAESKTQMGEGGGWGGGIPEIKSTAASFVRMQLLGANPSPTMAGLEELPGKVNYLIGGDRAKWQTEVSLFSRVRTEQVYPGVDLLFHGDDGQLEYDFIVAPGADPSKIAFRIRGAAHIEIDSHGDLVLHTSDSDFRMRKPVIYQMVGSERRLIDGSFIRKGKQEVAFQIGPYDHAQELVIDPKLNFASFIGGNGVEEAFGTAVDDSTPGSPKLYIAGATTDSTTFPETSKTIGSGTSSTTPVVVEVGFIAKIDPTTTGSASLVYLTFVGGKTPFQAADAGCESAFEWLALDKSQGTSNVQPVVGGVTNCSDYPFTTTLNPETGPSTHDLASIVTRLTSSGADIDQAALLGGNQEVSTAFVSASSAGNITVSGSTRATNLPVMNAYVATFNNAVAGAIDCYLAKLERSDLKITYATYLNAGQGSTTTSQTGCGGFEDSSGNILAGGNTESGAVFNLGVGGANLANGFQPNYCPVASPCPSTTIATFAMKLNPNLSGVNQLLYGTYYSGGGDTRAHNGSFDLGNGVVAIVGGTTSATTGATSPDIPLKNAYQTTNKGAVVAGGQTGYLLVLDTTQTGANSLLMSTYIGGSSGNDTVRAVSYDAADPTSFRIVIGGETASTDFPTMNPIQTFQGTAGTSVDAFISVFKVPQPGQAAFNAGLYFSTLIGSGTTTTAGGQFADSERIDGLAVDSNHTIYATGYALSSSFFTPSGTTPNGFQTTCTSCGGVVPESDAVVFTIGTGGNATLTSITVSPSSASIGEGQTQQFTALGFFSDGTVGDITNTAVWASSVTTIATISNTTGTNGLATASTTNTGSTQITAALNGVTSAAVTVTVTAPVTVTVSVASNNTSGGTIVDNSKPPLINCFTNGAGIQSGICSANYAVGAVVTFTETPGPGAALTSWNGPCGAGTGGVTTTCSITVTNPIGVTSALYTNGPGGPFTLTMALPANQAASTGNGTVNSGITGGGIDCKFVGTTPPAPVTGGACSNPAEKDGEVVQLIPVPDQNSSFGGWAGTCPFQLSGSNDCYVTMSQAQTVTPVFTAAQVTVNVSITGNGSVVDNANPLQIHCSNTNGSIVGPCSAQYNSGATVTLTESAGTGYTFTSFTGCNTTTATTCTLNLNSANPVVNVTATFNTTAAPVTLTLSLSGTNGSVLDQDNAGKIQCSIAGGVVSGICSAPYNPGTQVSLQATGGTSSSFNGWTAGPCGDTSTNPCAFTITTNTNATATFTATAQTFTLMVNEAGSSSGTVTSQSGLNPAINCTSEGPGCSATYNSGTQVTLTAAPATGSSFMGWVGGTPACTGTSTCTVTMNQTQSVTAIFNTSGRAIVADWNVTGEGDNDKQRIDGKSPPLLVKLTNTSPTQTVHVMGVSADNAAYKVTTTCTTLGPGQSCTVSSSFTATSLCQSQNTTITVADDDPGGNFTYTIEGFGADSGLQVDDLTDPTLTPQSLAQSLVGPGVTISNVTYTGAKRAAGTFTSSSNIIGFNSGIVLSTGSVRNTVGPNCSTGISVDNGEPGDPDLSTLSGGATNDAAVLQFDFVPTSTSVSFQYVFASDEYPEFVGQFNDTFAFFLNGANIALIPGTNLPVTINDVNGGSNPQFFVDNNFQSPTAAPVDTEMDGLTVVLTAQAQVTPGNTYHIKLAIADALDFALDSNVFIEAGSLSSTALSFSPSSVAFGKQTVGVESAGTPVTLTNNSTTAVSISQIAATAPFNETNLCPAQLAPAGQSGSSCVITVTITPPSATTFTGSLTVTFNSPTAGSQSIPLSGTGVGSAAATHFLVSAPSTATAGTAFSFTVTAQDASNNTVTTYAGTVHFTSSDGAAVLPANSTLTNGVGTFSATLNTPGGQTIKATDTVTASITGTSGTITVSTPAPTLVSIAVTPPNQTILTGQTLQYTATGTYSDNSTKNITTQVVWASSNTEAATVSNATGSQGLAMAASSLSATATTTISATLGETSGSTMLTVAATPVVITVAPPPPGQPAVPVINPGGAAVYGLVLTSQPGFSGTITLSCTATTSTGAPASQFITCAPDPNSVTIKPGGTTQVAIVLNTFCSRNAPLDLPVPGGPAGVLIVALTALALGSVTWMYRRRPRSVLTFAALTIAVYSIVGCGSTPKGTAGATPAGNYNLALSFRVNGGPPIPGPLLQLIIK
jgi:List-Bact-rpt repeat protein/Big-like domain-containing protein